MFSIGSEIVDPKGNPWIVTQTWLYNEYICLALLGARGAVAGQLGGARFRSGEEILIRRQ